MEVFGTFAEKSYPNKSHNELRALESWNAAQSLNFKEIIKSVFSIFNLLTAFWDYRLVNIGAHTASYTHKNHNSNDDNGYSLGIFYTLFAWYFFPLEKKMPSLSPVSCRLCPCGMCIFHPRQRVLSRINRHLGTREIWPLLPLQQFLHFTHLSLNYLLVPDFILLDSGCSSSADHEVVHSHMATRGKDSGGKQIKINTSLSNKNMS